MLKAIGLKKIRWNKIIYFCIKIVKLLALAVKTSKNALCFARLFVTLHIPM